MTHWPTWMSDDYWSFLVREKVRLANVDGTITDLQNHIRQVDQTSRERFGSDKRSDAENDIPYELRLVHFPLSDCEFGWMQRNE